MLEGLAGLGAGAEEQFILRIARRIALLGPAANDHQSSDSLTQRLFAAVTQLNAWGYQARWEARPDAPAWRWKAARSGNFHSAMRRSAWWMPACWKS